MSDLSENIFAGTQVVSSVEIRGTNRSLVQPRDAMGVVCLAERPDYEKANAFLIRARRQQAVTT